MPLTLNLSIFSDITQKTAFQNAQKFIFLKLWQRFK